MNEFNNFFVDMLKETFIITALHFHHNYSVKACL